VLVQPLEPAQLVREFRPRGRIAIRQVQRADDKLTDLRFDVATVGVFRIAGQRATSLFCIFSFS
jgi:hypothetical protein